MAKRSSSDFEGYRRGLQEGWQEGWQEAWYEALEEAKVVLQEGWVIMDGLKLGSQKGKGGKGAGGVTTHSASTPVSGKEGGGVASKVGEEGGHKGNGFDKGKGGFTGKDIACKGKNILTARTNSTCLR